MTRKVGWGQVSLIPSIEALIAHREAIGAFCASTVKGPSQGR